MLVVLIGLVIGGFILGGLARLAVPGPDPMPFWLTVGIGIAGSLIGGFVAQILLDRPAGSFLAGYVTAILLVILYRRVVQKRGITGPEARARPTRGWGLRR